MKKYITLTILLLITNFNLRAQVTPIEKAALLALYNTTDGPNWKSEQDADTTDNWNFTGNVTNSWFGITVTGGHITSIDLNPTNNFAGSNNLSGILPTELGDLQFLETLDLSVGNLTGSIPIEITTLANLRILSLTNNGLSNTIPIEVTDMIELRTLRLSNNQFIGFIYPEYGDLLNLRKLYLSGNNLTGSIPTEIGDLINLTHLNIGVQLLTGTLPVSIRKLINLRVMKIYNTNVTGDIPTEYGELVNLKWLKFASNKLTGGIPNSFGNLTSLNQLNLWGNRLTGSIPVSLSNLTQLRTFKVGSNQLSGSISPLFSQWTNLIDFNIHHNKISGTIPDNFAGLTSLRYFSIENNLLSGNLSPLFSQWTSIWQFNASQNQFTGNIPSTYSQWTNLNYFSVANNQLEGAVPNFTGNVNIKELNFGINKFQFGDFENQHVVYTSIINYTDNPQTKVNAVETRNLAAGSNTSMVTNCSGTQNKYQWYKDNIVIASATNSTLNLNSLQATDAGVYHCNVTSDIVTDLTIQRHEITLNIAAGFNQSDHFVTTWKTDNPGDSNSTSIIIPTFSGETYLYDVDWDNNGTWETGFTGNASHDYGVAGTHTVRIRGIFPRIFFDDLFDKEKILSVDQWGTQVWTSMAHAFYGCNNLAGQANDTPDLSIVEEMSNMFSSATKFNQSIDNWNTQNIRNMSNMFKGATAFNQDLNSWKTENVTTMKGMFANASAFDKPINNWNTTSLSIINSMFSGATKFNQDLSNWKTEKVTSMVHVFYKATSFNGDISTWDTQNVTNMLRMFNGATAFNQDLNNWNTEKVTTMRGMYYKATSFKGNISSWKTQNVTTMLRMFKEASSFDRDISSWDTRNVTIMQEMFENATSFNQPIIAWKTQKVTNMVRMFENATAFNQNIGAWKIVSLTKAQDMFRNVTLSKGNYDGLLIGWEAQPHNNNVRFSGGNSLYCAGETAHIALVNTTADHWIITDGGLDCNLAAPNCPTVISPVNGDVDIPIKPTINWNASGGATKYRVVIIKISNNTEVLNKQLSNVLTYALPTNLESNTEYSITVYASNNAGESAPCSSINFTTEISTLAPNCPTVISPVNGDVDIPIKPTINWNASGGATKYRIVIIKISNNTEVLNKQLSNVLTYALPINLENNTEYSITVYASNDIGESAPCSSINFTTETTVSAAIQIPDFFSPNNDGVNDFWEVNDNSNTINHIYIFDRYGKVLKKLLPNQNWNGNYVNKPMNEADYWYLIKLNSGKQLTGHFSLLRK